MIKLPWCVYSRSSEASVSNDGKIPVFLFVSFLFLSSVIKFDEKCVCVCEFNSKITITQLLKLTSVSAKSTLYSPRRGYLSPGNSIVLEIAATLLFISVTIFF